ncbi:hypothetical protein HAHE_19510 [Haloferula helveola]|uniref:Uncharacterized protein n=1 Tax=Haloferula helveola TaxID=490095 RepID=A0ABN6H4N6_9BACT|nr:hypothetical protein HAHE_19510 [Haloferula helveola]
MDEEPEIPAPPPEVPRGRLWGSLVVPPILTVLGTIILALIGSSGMNYGAEVLLMLPIGLVAIIICLVYFILAWRVRYHGRTLVLTSIGYFLGQIILCLCLWYGCCFAVLA